MKKIVFILIVSLKINLAYSQLFETGAFANENFVDSMFTQLNHAANDTVRVNSFISLGEYYTFIRQDSSIFYFRQGIELAERINYAFGGYSGYVNLAFVLNTASNYGKALDMVMKSLKIAEKLKTGRDEAIAGSYSTISLINFRNNFDTIALNYARLGIKSYHEASLENGKIGWAPASQIALIYFKQGHLDSAYYYAKMGYDLSLKYPLRGQSQLSVTACILANIYQRKGNIQLAREYFQRAIESDKKYNVPLLRVRLFNNIARFYKNIGKLDSCIYYGEIAFQSCQNRQYGEQATDASSLVAHTYELLGMPDSALKYTKIYIAAEDTIFNQSKLLQIQLLNFDEGQRQKEIQREINEVRERYVNRIRYYALIATAAIFLLLSLILYRNNRNKQIANKALELQKMEIDQQRAKAETMLQELRSTQAQLIQSEKMASLGELTAGVAHEIQNPLNFVNNFSEVNSELIIEMKEELDKGNTKEAKLIADNIEQNLDKINIHGKRADSIVKGMLQHSRISHGQKDLTDINALADEYLRLSYHGLRAKDPSFEARLNTSFDPSIGKINIVAQDIGRVLINLYNNAFYAVSEKAKQQSDGFIASVNVSSKKSEGKVEIRVKDNGNGIPRKIMDKIFQPFFTTKPAGQGTGLGLSISYDIIRSHGGELKVETKEGEYTEFTIRLKS